MFFYSFFYTKTIKNQNLSKKKNYKIIKNFIETMKQVLQNFKMFIKTTKRTTKLNNCVTQQIIKIILRYFYLFIFRLVNSINTKIYSKIDDNF